MPPQLKSMMSQNDLEQFAMKLVVETYARHGASELSNLKQHFNELVHTLDDLYVEIHELAPRS